MIILRYFIPVYILNNIVKGICIIEMKVMGNGTVKVNRVLKFRKYTF